MSQALLEETQIENYQVAAARIDSPAQAIKPYGLGFNKSLWTTAPLRMHGEFVFHASASEVFEKVTDPQTIASWFPIVTGGKTDHSASAQTGNWGEGSKRYCSTRGMGTLDETILHWEDPKGYAYNLKNWMMPIKDHVGVMTIEQIEPGKTLFRWEQFFNTKGLIMKHFFPTIMIALMNRGMKNLAKQLGGPGGRIHPVVYPKNHASRISN